MSTVAVSTSKYSRVPIVTLIAWVVTLAVSILPDVFWLELTDSVPTWLYPAKVGCAVVLLITTLLWPTFKPLRSLAWVLLVLLSLDWGVRELFSALRWEARLVGDNRFIHDMWVVQGPRFTLALLMTGFLWFLTRNRHDFFLALGKLDAAADPIPLIMTRPSSWRILGPFLSIALAGGLTVFMVVFGSPLAAKLVVKTLPLLPFVFLFATMNAYGEEMIYRASFLATLENVVGSRQALLITAAFFGVMHYFGMPYGVLGVVMSAFVGWLMGKAMLETRGFFWAWCIHFCMDVAAFFFIALGTVTPGG